MRVYLRMRRARHAIRLIASGMLCPIFLSGCAGRSFGLLVAEYQDNAAGSESGRVLTVNSLLDVRSTRGDAGFSVGPRQAVYYLEASYAAPCLAERRFRFITPPLEGELKRKVIRHQGLEVGVDWLFLEVDLGVATTSVTNATLDSPEGFETYYNRDHPGKNHIRFLSETAQVTTQHEDTHRDP